MGGAVVGAFYVLQSMAPRRGFSGLGEVNRLSLADGLDRHVRTMFSAMGTALLTLLLWHRTSAALLTIAWGLEGAVLLASGFALRERVLRISGLALLALCMLKLFAYDFRNLDALPRILSFIVLGMAMLVASWVYTRYRDRLQRYL